MKILSLILSSLLLGGSLIAQPEEIEPPRPQDEIMLEAYEKAQAEGKKVFVMFHASWCGWCKTMDKAINDKACKKHFDQNYIIVHLDVLERGDKEETLENPGAEELMNDFGGASQGLPYWVVLSENGELLADSKMRSDNNDRGGSNIGCPASEKEVAQLLLVLTETREFEEAALKAIQKRFRANEH